MSAACLRRWQLVSSTAFSALALTACGGDGDSSAEPKLPAGVGSALATQANRVASELEAGNPGGARSAALRLDAAVERAIAAGRVPPELRGPLREAVDSILASVPAPAPTTTPTVEEPDDEGKGKGEGKDKGKGKGKDKDDGDHG